MFLYRGVEQLVARRAHNPEVVRFKSHPRNQKMPWYVSTEAIFFTFINADPDGPTMIFFAGAFPVDSEHGGLYAVGISELSP